MIIKRHSINRNMLIIDAIKTMNQLNQDMILFVVDDDNKLLATLTDGDLRRYYLRDKSNRETVLRAANKNFVYLTAGESSLSTLKTIREKQIQHVPVISTEGHLEKIIDFKKSKNYLQIPAVIMAGGQGLRLRPLTEKIPKPMLPIGSVPILETVINHLVDYGIIDLHICVNYLAKKIIDHFEDGKNFDCDIKYIHEETPRGTLGSLSNLRDFAHSDLLLINSDILTNIDYGEFYQNHKLSSALISIATTNYNVKVPYATLKTVDGLVKELSEKPSVSFTCNAGIYLLSKKCISKIPSNGLYNTTDLIDSAIAENKCVNSWPITNYWLDIGNKQDYEKANDDYKTIKF